jgi:methyl-accepting chemotaxis protein
MPRGVRKSSLEKLQEELKSTQDAIEQYKSAIKTQEERVKQIQEEIKLEQLKELSTVLEENNMSIDELKELISRKDKN